MHGKVFKNAKIEMKKKFIRFKCKQNLVINQQLYFVNVLDVGIHFKSNFYFNYL